MVLYKLEVIREEIHVELEKVEFRKKTDSKESNLARVVHFDDD